MVDIVVAHVPFANQVRFFDLPAACIVTGPHSMMADVIAGKVYLALDCSPASYAVIDREEGWQIEYVAGACRIGLSPGEGAAADGCDPAFLRNLMEGRGPLSYREEVEALRRAKREIPPLGREEAVLRLFGMGIRKTHVAKVYPLR